VQVLANLLANACKYTEPGGQVWLSAERGDDEVLFRVRDTGVGLPPELLGRVFDLFAQAQPGAQGGLGIGLALVRGLTELHGGSVVAFSDGPGEGSEFVVRLPAALPEPHGQRGEAPAAEAAAHGPSRRILVVDDDIDGAQSLALLLGAWGHEVREAHDGVTALEAARAFRPQVVLLDIGLPGGLDGNEVARRLRDQEALDGVVLVALTGWGQDEDRRRAREAGFDHFFVKPLDPETLGEWLARLESRGDKLLPAS
jgi:two-component system CheB/CheR fusion protein